MIQTMAGQVRALCIAVEEKWKIKVMAGAPIFRWIVRHAAWIHNRFQQVHGCTPFAAVRGHVYHGQVMGFGDPVMIRVPDLKQIPKLEPRWIAGIWLGKTIDGDEHIAGTASGIRAGCSARPMAAALVAPELCRLVKWQPFARKEDAETEQRQTDAPELLRAPVTQAQLEAQSTPEQQSVAQDGGRVSAEPIRPRGGAATRLSTELREFLEDNGPTPACAGCKRSRIRAGLPTPGSMRHSILPHAERGERTGVR